MGLFTETIGPYDITKLSDGKYSVHVNNGNMGACITDEAGVERIKQKYAHPQTNGNTTNTLERSPKQDTLTISQNNEPTPKSTSKKGLIAAGLALLATAATLIITRGKVKNTKALNTIPEDLRAIFGELKGKQGEEFTNAAYEKMVEYLKLKGVAPDKIIKLGEDGVMSINGGYDQVANTIGYTEGFLKKLRPQQQINLIAHELKHCEQFTNILRTEGVTVENYARVMAENDVKQALNEPFNFLFKSGYERAVQAGKGEEFLEKIITDRTEKLAKIIKENFADVLKMPKIKADSAEGKKALEQLESMRNYEGLNMFGLGGEAYKNHPIEVEAYEFGDMIEKMFTDFLKATK